MKIPYVFLLNSPDILERDILVFTILQVIVKQIFNLSELSNAHQIVKRIPHLDLKS